MLSDGTFTSQRTEILYKQQCRGNNTEKYFSFHFTYISSEMTGHSSLEISIFVSSFTLGIAS